MPSAPPRPCTTPGCPELAAGKYGRCPDCEAEADRKRGTQKERGYDSRWRRASERTRAERPLCEWPGGCTALADTVDHIDGDATGPRRLDPTNHRPLCWMHHRIRTAADQPGGVRLH